MIEKVFEHRANIEILSAPNAQKGITLAQSIVPDLILMDMSLPYLNGWEATKIIRENEDTHHIPIIALTAHALMTDKQRGLEAGCNDYLTKPVNFDKLVSKIHKLTGVKSIEN